MYSKNSLVTGSSLLSSSKTKSSLYRNAQNIFNHLKLDFSIDDHVPVLVNNMGFLFALLGPNYFDAESNTSCSDKAINPVLWCKCIETYLNLRKKAREIDSCADHERRYDMQHKGIDALVRTGEEFLLVINSLQTNTQFFDQLLNELLEASDVLKVKVNQEVELMNSELQKALGNYLHATVDSSAEILANQLNHESIFGELSNSLDIVFNLNSAVGRVLLV